MRRSLHECFVELPVLDLDRLQLRVFLGLPVQRRVVLRLGVTQQRAQLLERRSRGTGDAMEIRFEIPKRPALLGRDR